MPHLKAVQDSGLIQFDDEHSQNARPLVHGILVSSLFSSIFGSLAPGCVYLNQSLQFEKPVFANDRVLARLEIEKVRKWRKGGLVLQCKTTVAVDRGEAPGTFTTKAIGGVAKVWLPSAHQ